MELWSKLPDGGTFSKKQRTQWLEVAKLALDMVYSDDPDQEGA